MFIFTVSEHEINLPTKFAECKVECHKLEITPRGFVSPWVWGYPFMSYISYVNILVLKVDSPLSNLTDRSSLTGVVPIIG